MGDDDVTHTTITHNRTVGMILKLGRHNHFGKAYCPKVEDWGGMSICPIFAESWGNMCLPWNPQTTGLNVKLGQEPARPAEVFEVGLAQKRVFIMLLAHFPNVVWKLHSDWNSCILGNFYTIVFLVTRAHLRSMSENLIFSTFLSETALLPG